MNSIPLNPFRAGKPVPPTRLIGRNIPIKTIVSGIHQMATALITGLPHIGKSSLLAYIADEKIRAEKLGQFDSQLHWQDFDCHLLPSDFRPRDFWERLFTQLETDGRFEKMKPRIERVRASQFSSFELSTFFKHCAYLPLGVVLVVDEFETLLSHPGFEDVQFFRTLRSVASNTDGLMMIAASRLRMAKLHERIRKQMDGSPVFNTQMEVCLPPLEDAEVDQLMDQALSATNVTFDPTARNLVVRLAGRHPYLVQVAASALFDGLLEQGTPDHQMNIATKLFQDRSDGFFSDLWRYLEPEAQLALVILALAETNGHALGHDYNTGDLAHLDWYKPELDRLAGMGLVDGETDSRWHADAGNFVLWHGGRWRFSAAGMIDWLLNNPVAEARKKDSFDEWLQRNQFEGLVTHAEKDQLKSLLKAVPETVWRETGTFLGGFAKGWLGTLTKSAA
jgi:AAA-like domain